MNAKHLILTLSLTLAGGVAAAALSRGSADPARPASLAECSGQASQGAIARVVVTARRDPVEAAAVEIPRVVVTGRRPVAAVAALRP